MSRDSYQKQDQAEAEPPGSELQKWVFSKLEAASKQLEDVLVLF